MSIMSKRLFVVVSVLGLGAGAIAACAFPDVTFAPDDSIDGGDAGSPDGALDGPTGEGGPTKPDVDPEGGAKDASSAGDASQIDAAGCKTCDCDSDGFNRVQLDAGCDGGPIGKLPDCDDNNPAIHPGLGFILDPWPSSTPHKPAGDWDCSGETTKQYDYGGVCTALSACSNGFVGDPPCGTTSAYLTCQEPLPLLGLTCSEKKRENPGARVQGCH